MTRKLFLHAVTAACFAAASLCPLNASTQQPAAAPAHGGSMPDRATGPFEVKVTPQDDKTPGIARLSIDKQFHGELEAVSKGEMLANGGDQGTGGYVAMELVTGKLGGRAGSFALQHSGTMQNNDYRLTVIVVPGSGTGELTGIDGVMKIIITPDGKHSYDFEYTLPAR